MSFHLYKRMQSSHALRVKLNFSLSEVPQLLSCYMLQQVNFQNHFQYLSLIHI